MPFDIIIGRNESDKRLFGKRGLAYIGKTYVKMGNYTSLSNPLWLDVVRSHVILVAGKRGGGKSYTLGVMAEALSSIEKEVAKNIAPLIFDTMGIYWTMKFRNSKDSELLSEWDLEAKNTPVKVFVHYGYFDNLVGKGIPADEKFALKLSELDAEDWISLFNLHFTDQEAVLIESVLSILKQKESFSFEDINKLIKSAVDVSQEVKNSTAALFDAAETWRIFSDKEGIKVADLINPGETTVVDLSMYSSVGSFNIRALVIGLVSKKLFEERMLARKDEEIQAVQHGMDYNRFRVNRKTPLVWIFIDEAHEFLPRPQDGKTPATDALVQLLREGRQPGISLVMATQQPGKIHTDAMTQADIVLSHRLTAEQDVNALNKIMQSYVLEGINKQMNDLPRLKGSAIILDDNSERIYPMRVRPRFTWHGGEAPQAIEGIKE